MAQIKEQIKSPEKELSDAKIATLSDAEFKTLVIRILREMTEYKINDWPQNKGRSEDYTK